MNKDEHLCPICGQPTYKYMGNYRKDGLCQKHANDLKSGAIIQDGTLFKNSKNGKVLNKDYKEPKIEDTPKQEKYSKCLVCGKKVEPGYFFCPECYYKFNKKNIYIKFTNCKSPELVDDFYDSHYKCDDGHMVKSLSERDIDNFFFKKEIRHVYEPTVNIETDKGVFIHPDFCLPNYNDTNEDVYIEFWGLSEGKNLEYKKSMKFKCDHYKKNKMTVISLYPEDLGDMEKSIMKKLNTYKKGIVNFIK